MSARLALFAGLSLSATLRSPAAMAADPPKVMQDLFNRAAQSAKERKPHLPTAPDAITPTLPTATAAAAKVDARYSPSADGQEVTDPRSGLTGRRCAEGMSLRGNSCTGTALAVDHAGALARAGGQAWRLPEVDELRSQATDSRPGPTIDSSLFPGTPAAPFWTTFQENPSTFKAVSFYNGDTDSRYHTSPHHVRLVRGGTPAAAPAFR